MKKYIGSCVCQKISFEITCDFEKLFFCHCSRCRKISGSAHCANLFASNAEFTWVSGENFVKTFQLPNTRFSKSFCNNCGSSLPNLRDNKNVVVPAGSLDSDLGTTPTGHIHMASKANWDENLEDAAKFDVYP